MRDMADIDDTEYRSVEVAKSAKGIDDSLYQAMLADPDYVEVVRPRNFMRRSTWERYKKLFPAYATIREREEARMAAQKAASMAQWAARKARGTVSRGRE